MQTQKPINSFADLVSVFFGLGFLPKAPGTWGSLPGIPLAWCCHLFCQSFSSNKSDFLSGSGLLLAILILALLSWLATWCIKQTEKAWNSHDDKSIVVDEVIGQMFALVWFQPGVDSAILGFVLFRLFDIFKPGPIGYVDKNIATPFGTLLDDIIAGIFAGLSMLVINLFWK